MQATDKLFAGSIPRLYDRCLGPLLFEAYATDLAARVASLSPARVLETAAGTGIATRALRAALPDATEIVATDLNPPMLEHAANVTTLANVSWQPADALALPFPDASFDVVTCQFGAMFFPDKRAGYAEARRVLRPGGAFVFNVWDRIEDNELADEVIKSMEPLYPDDPPRFLARTPHGYFDVATILGELDAAGFGDVETEVVARRSRAASAREPAVAFCQGTPFRAELELRAPGRLDEMTDVVERALVARFGAGPLDAKMQAIVLVAR